MAVARDIGAATTQEGASSDLWRAAAAAGCSAITAALAAGAAINWVTDDKTPLMAAAHYHRVAAVQELLRCGAAVRVEDPPAGMHYSCLEAAWLRYDDDTWTDYDAAVEITALLLDAGADVQPLRIYYPSALSLAAAIGSLRGVQLLLAAGAEPAAPRSHAPLIYAAVCKDDELDVTGCFEALLAAGANACEVDSLGLTALHFAAAHCAGAHYHRVARLLVAAGADVDARAHDGSTPLRYTLVGGPRGLDAQCNRLQRLLAMGAKPDPVFWANVAEAAATVSPADWPPMGRRLLDEAAWARRGPLLRLRAVVKARWKAEAAAVGASASEACASDHAVDALGGAAAAAAAAASAPAAAAEVTAAAAAEVTAAAAAVHPGPATV
jgi:ankyrin repeat protein